MKNEKLKLILNSISVPLIGSIAYAVIYKIDFLAVFAIYMLVFTPIWLILSNIKLILKLSWVKVVFICIYFTLIVVIFGALPLELGVWVKNTRELSLGAFIDAFKLVFLIALPSNIIMTAIIVITKAFYSFCQKKKNKKLGI